VLKKISIISLVCLSIFAAFAYPIYQFYAHKGEANFPPWGWVKLPLNSQAHQHLFNSKYRNEATQALKATHEHRQSINAPGISAAVAIDGELVWVGLSGWADIEAALPMSIDTQFRIGSTSKAVTATALARLIGNGLIDLDSPIAKYHPSLPNTNWGQIKVRHLASHMSGLPHYKQFDDKYGLYKSMALNSHFDDVNDALTLFDTTKLQFEPGTQFSYSTYGTVLLSAVMQEVANKAFLDLLKEEVFYPIGLHSTQDEASAKQSNKLAKFYWNDDGKSEHFRVWREVDLSHRLAGGGLVSTSADLVKLASAYLDRNYLSEQTVSAVWQAQTLDNGEINEQHYAIGWRANEVMLNNERVLAIHHGGVSRGAQSFLITIPEQKISIAVNINSKTADFSEFSRIWRDLATLFISKR